ncbi:hypothetical protein KP509_09G087300 [Ceratopteris richardii]|uniref:MYB transcription factor n=1 Tax=Ceratopteris richardii TaxID=49495 RepID=A0A8T2U8E7_CERRI|nr:hypothetical protein KP509_09G087300 [Ceratopteris richardii]KAH7430187.1 hypothetical protein KP509_09G087300 [Ceratopteris richardii]
MKSGVVKQKWTPEEEAALRAGVEKYGAGKWRAIQKDAKYGACLISRSNVDLKDKWRNMSVSANGVGSRERAARILAAKMKQIGTTSPAGNPITEASEVDALSGATAKYRKLLGTKFDQLIMEAILSLKDDNGGTKGQIASYMESHYLVPANFRRLLGTKLDFLTQQGKLIKMRRNYIIAPDVAAAEEFCEEQGFYSIEATEDIASKFRGMDVEKVAILAAQAVADADAAATAAEEAAKVAEIAEAEWEAAEAAADMAAALASGSARMNIISSRRGSSAIHM